MKRLGLFVAFLLFLSLSSFSNELLQKAEKAYDSKKYKEAIEAYEQLIKSGYKSYELYFNLGNAYYRDRQLGKAIYNYERARKLNPIDEDVRINLGIASSKTVDKIDSKENFFISAVKTNLLSSFSTKGWAWLSVVSLLLFCASVFLFFTAGRTALRRAGFFLAVFFLCGFLFSYFLGVSALRSKHENKFAIITAREAKIMNEPTPPATGKFTLHEGTKVRVVEHNGDWLLIKLDNGNEGWIKLQDIGVI